MRVHQSYTSPNRLQMSEVPFDIFRLCSNGSDTSSLETYCRHINARPLGEHINSSLHAGELHHAVGTLTWHSACPRLLGFSFSFFSFGLLGLGPDNWNSLVVKYTVDICRSSSWIVFHIFCLVLACIRRFVLTLVLLFRHICCMFEDAIIAVPNRIEGVFFFNHLIESTRDVPQKEEAWPSALFRYLYLKNAGHYCCGDATPGDVLLWWSWLWSCCLFWCLVCVYHPLVRLGGCGHRTHGS